MIAKHKKWKTTAMSLDIEDLKPVTERLDPTLGKHIDCGPGWFQIIMDLHNDLVRIDPNYRIFQIKEKFGGLRFYYSASTKELQETMQPYVNLAERRSFGRCEITGQPGYLMTKGGRLRTLAITFLNEGWEIADGH